MRKHRSPKVVWLPPDPLLGMVSGQLVIQRFAHDLASPGAAGSSVSSFLAVTIDQPQIDASIISLADVEDSSYRLRRIVGKIFVSAQQSTGDDSDGLLCTAGFIVLGVNGSGIPLRSATAANPALAGNSEDPWIWRRSWLIANGSSIAPADTDFNESSPFSNYEGGPSALDGPHVDQKTARIVSQDQRLFLVCTTTSLNPTTISFAETNWVTDLRILASMRTSQGNRRNASR